jgi:GDP-L-fucose synthase
MDINSKILILGANGMVGHSLISKLKTDGYINLITPSSKHLDLRDQFQTRVYFEHVKPDYVFFLAARVGGIVANMKSPATFGFDNLIMQTNVIEAAYVSNVKKMLFMGSSCIYPRDCPQPMKEEYLLTGPLEPTNEMYALSKISGLKLCAAYLKQHNCDFISCMPCNLYGPHDNFNPETSHVISGLIYKFHKAKMENKSEYVCMGTGSAKREFLFSDDVADACCFLMNNYSNDQHINVGSGVDCTIKELAETVKEVVGFAGELKWDPTKPDGMPRKIMDVSKMEALGWKSKTSLKDGIIATYEWFKGNIK